MEAKTTEERLRDYFSSRAPEVQVAYLFGSEGRGTAGPASDVDLGVLYAEKPSATLDSPNLALEGDLERLLGRPVQVIVLNSAPADLIHRVLRDGRLVFEADRSSRIAFEVRARNEYFDLLPFLRRYRKLRHTAS